MKLIALYIKPQGEYFAKFILTKQIQGSYRYTISVPSFFEGTLPRFHFESKKQENMWDAIINQCQFH